MRHLLLAAVPAERTFRLRTLDPDRFQWVAVNNWPEAVEAIRGKPVDMAVVDPLLGSGEPRPHGIERLRQFFPSLPLLVYTDLTPANAGVLLQLGRAGIRRVIVHRFEDAPGALRSAILNELEAERLATGDAGAGADLPRAAARIARCARGDAARSGGRAHRDALAERARLTRRTCERWFTKVGLPSPRMVMVLIRLLYAHRLLLDPGYTVEDVALKLGYSKTKTLQMHLRAVFGFTAGELRVSLSTEDALAAVTHRYFTPLRQVAS